MKREHISWVNGSPENAHAEVVLAKFSDDSLTGVEEDRYNQIHPCRLLVPHPGEEHEVGMHHQEDVHEQQQVVCVPEGVEASQVVQRRWELHDAAPEGVHRQREGKGHDDDHEDAGDPRGAL